MVIISFINLVRFLVATLHKNEAYKNNLTVRQIYISDYSDKLVSKLILQNLIHLNFQYFYTMFVDLAT